MPGLQHRTLHCDIECFGNESKVVYERFLSFTEGEQKAYLDWIYSAKTEDTKVERIAKMMERLEKKLKFYDKENHDSSTSH